MPKGTQSERDVMCRACGQIFRTTRCGKAAFYCRQPECDEQRRRTRFTVANTNGRRVNRALSVDALLARQERERDRFERQWRRVVEPWTRNVIAARRREQQRALAAAARDAERQHREREKFNRQADRLRPRVQAAVSRALDLGAELSTLEAAAHGTQVRASAGSLSSRLDPGDDSLIARYVRQHLDDVAFLSAGELAQRIGTSGSSIVRFAQLRGFRGYPEMQRAAQNEYRGLHGGTIVLHDGTTAGPDIAAPAAPEPVVERAIFEDELLEAIAEMLLERGSDPAPGRQELQRAVVRCARAAGLEATRATLLQLAVEALAWARVLPPRVNAADIDTQAMRDAA